MGDKWIYAGVLDDSHLRYDRTAIAQGPEFFQDQLLKQVFFGHPILLNDGYVFSDIGLDHLIDPDSLLRYLLSNGFVRVITRAAELNADAFCRIPEEQAARGQETAKRLIARPDYEEIKKSIQSFAQIANNGRIERFPNRKMHEGFHKLMRRISDKTVEDIGIFGMTTQRWQDFIGAASKAETYHAFPRTAIEEHAKALHGRQELSWPTVESIMAVANQAYHYNFALCLSDEKGVPVAADTTIGFAFEDLMGFDQTHEIDPHDWRDAPRISIPKNFPRNKKIRPVIEDFITPGTEAHDAKMRFLEDSATAISSGGSNRRGELDRIFEEYRQQIARTFSDNGYRTPTGVLAGAATGAAIGVGVSAVDGTLGFFHTSAPVAGALAGLFGTPPNIENLRGLGPAIRYAKRLTRGANRRLVEMSIRNPPDGRPDGNRHIPVYSGVAFNGSAARDHVSDIPRFS